MKNVSPSYFKHQFLIAMPHMHDQNFAQTLTYIVEHNANGAMGLVINRPQSLSLADILEQLRPEMSPPVRCQHIPIHVGGPVQTDRGFVLHAPAGDYTSSIRLGDLALTTSRDVLQAVAEGSGPVRMLVTLGYAGWGAGQLENEMAQNAWLNVSANLHIIFDVPPDERYPAALKLLGFDPVMLTGDAGHA